MVEQDWLPGVLGADDFPSELARDVVPASAHFVSLPVGRDLSESVDDLFRHLRKLQSSQISALPSIDCARALITGLDHELGIETPASTPELWAMENAERLQWPRAFVVPSVVRDEPTLHELLLCAAAIATTSRDLGGPLTFFLVQQGPPLPREVEIKRWSGLHVMPGPLPYWRSDRSLLRRGFEVYLSLRAYWEAAGRPGELRRHAEVHRQVPRWSSTGSTDQLVDRCFDLVHSESGLDPGAVLDAFERELSPDELRVACATGVLRVRGRNLDELECAGLAWRPTGSPRAFVTGGAAWALTRSKRFSESQTPTVEATDGFRRMVRRNEVLASWVHELCSQVEREVRNLCRSDDEINQKIAAVGLTDKLEAERGRNRAGLMYEKYDGMIEFATLMDLQMLVQQTPNLLRVLPMSVERLNRVRLVRNLAAHLHSVSWFGVEQVLSALEEFNVS